MKQEKKARLSEDTTENSFLEMNTGLHSLMLASQPRPVCSLDSLTSARNHPKCFRQIVNASELMTYNGRFSGAPSPAFAIGSSHCKRQEIRKKGVNIRYQISIISVNGTHRIKHDSMCKWSGRIS